MKKTVLLTALITAVIVSVCFIGYYYVHIDPILQENSILVRINEIQKKIDEHAVKDFDKDTAEDYAVAYYLAGLDDMYCEYMLPDGYETFLDELEGNFTGVGIKVYTQQGNIVGGITILRVLGNSPAEAAGLRPMDMIVEVDGVSVIGEDYDSALNRILGEVDTEVILTVERDGAQLTFTVKRSRFTQRLVDYRVINENIGYVQIHEFETVAYGEFVDAINNLLLLGVEGFIFDVRNNPGGGLSVVEGMVDLLIDKDELVVLQYKDHEEIKYGKDGTMTDLPSVVLVNGSSASASELFSSALRDVNGTLLIGDQTFGKGVGQTTHALDDGSALRLTTFYYVTKSRTNYDEIGLVPDIKVSLDDEDMYAFYTLDETNDEQLIAAIDELYSIINN